MGGRGGIQQRVKGASSCPRRKVQPAFVRGDKRLNTPKLRLTFNNKCSPTCFPPHTWHVNELQSAGCRSQQESAGLLALD